MTTRPLLTPLITAVYNVLSTIYLGGKQVNIGIGEKPDCPPPYLILSNVTGTFVSGPIGDPEADGQHRIQVAAIGDTSIMASSLLDKARQVLTRDAVDAELPGRRVMYLWLDLGRGEVREERSLPEPVFSDIDQYIIATTPGA